LGERLLVAFFITTNNIAELWDVMHGVDIAWRLGYKHLILEMYLKLVINWLTTHGILASDIYVLVCD